MMFLKSHVSCKSLFHLVFEWISIMFFDCTGPCIETEIRIFICFRKKPGLLNDELARSAFIQNLNCSRPAFAIHIANG
jgi:hypothetical protein